MREAYGNLTSFHEACDRGEYLRLGELSAASSAAELRHDYAPKTANGLPCPENTPKRLGDRLQAYRAGFAEVLGPADEAVGEAVLRPHGRVDPVPGHGPRHLEGPVIRPRIGSSNPLFASEKIPCVPYWRYWELIGAGRVFCACEQVSDDPSFKAHTLCPPDKKDRYIQEDLIWGNIAASASVLWRRPNIEDLPEWFMDVPVCDWPLHMLVADRGWIGYLDLVMCAHRVHEGECGPG